MSAVEEAVLAKHQAPDHPIAKRRKRRKAGLLRYRATKRRATLQPPPVRAPMVGGSPVTGVHTLAIAYGPLPDAVGHGRLVWPLHCTSSARQVTGTGRWRSFATAFGAFSAWLVL